VKIGFVINDLATEKAEFTTVRLAQSAVNRGHEAWLLGVGDFVYLRDGSVHAYAAGRTSGKFKTAEAFLEKCKADDSRKRISVDDLDVLMLRNDPAEDSKSRPWAQTSGILFGQLAVARGVLVLNDPGHLADAINKTYFQHFPEAVRPQTCISCNPAEIKKFIDDHDGRAVVKPLQGSGGHGVFLVRPDDNANVNQIIEAVTRDGYAIVQEYLPAAGDGDLRLFVMNGEALQVNGTYAAFRRVNKSGDARSNISAGGQIEEAHPDDDALRLVEMVRPKLVNDGMFLVGLDIVGDKLMEINVFSPGGLGIAEKLSDCGFTDRVIEDMERKVEVRRYYGHGLSNVQMATL
jgi:glutathione synthase